MINKVSLSILLLGCLAAASRAASTPAAPAVAATPAAPAAPALSGEWDGAIVAVAAEMEVDTSIELAGDAAGRLRGELWFPTQRPKRFPLQDLAQDGADLSFFVTDEDGVKTFFTGRLSADRSEIAGTMHEREQRAPFTLHRHPVPLGPPPGPAVLQLAADGAALRNAFDGHAGHPRLVLILSPTLFSSRMTLRLVERYVLAADRDPDLLVIVVWEPTYGSDTEQTARQAAGLVDDARLVHFWSPTRFASSVWKPAFQLLGLSGKIMDPVLVFPKESRWQGSAPLPDRLYQTPRPDVPATAEHHFNALDLARALAPPPAGGR